MTDKNPALQALKAKILRAEIDRRGAIDGDLVQIYLNDKVVVSPRGELVAVDETGAPRVGRGPYYADMTVQELLDEVVAERPALFQPTADQRVSNTVNPFLKGESFNLSKGLAIWKADPELGERLAAEAGFEMGKAK